MTNGGLFQQGSNFLAVLASLEKQGEVRWGRTESLLMMVSDPSKSDASLVAHLRLGDRQAFGKLYERYKNAIYAYSVRVLADRVVAEDIVQETFMKMQSEAYAIRELDSFKSWLFRIARNEALMHLRRTRSNGTVGEEDVWECHTPLEQLISKERTVLYSTFCNN